MVPSALNRIILLLLLNVFGRVEACPSLCYCNSVMVDCYDRGLEEIPEGINTTAVYVNLNNNRIKTVTKDRLSRLSIAENLRLGDNQITVLQSGSFVNMTSLKQLDLSRNLIQEIERDAFENLPKIKVLRLNDNQLQHIDGFLGDLPSLERLDLSSNKLVSISKETFTYLNALNYLSLAGNQITSVSQSTVANLTLLSHLDLSRNPLKNVDSIWSGFSKLSSLLLSSCQLTNIPLDLPRTVGKLQLSNNSLTSISADALSQTKFLSDIYLDDNDINTIEDGAFTHSPYLAQIRLNNNKLRILPKPIPASVTRFSADGNEIQRVFQFNFDHDSKMISLSLKNNSIGALVANTFSRMAGLRYLYLDSNNIQVMYQMTYSRLRQLRTLSLNSNPIREVEKRGLGSLRALSRLSLSGIKGNVSGVKDDLFHDARSIQSLDLQGSPYLTASILNDTNVLQGLRAIKYLNLKNNNLTKIDVSLLKTWLPRLRSINLMQNPWRCNAELVPLREWMADSPNTFPSRDSVLCQSPDFLNGQPIVDVAMDLFTATTTISTTTVSVTTTMQSSTLSDHIETESMSNTGTDVNSTRSPPPMKTTQEQRSTLAPPLTRGSTSNLFQPTSTGSSASTSTMVPFKIPSSTAQDDSRKTLKTETSPIQTSSSVKTYKPTMIPATTFSPEARTTRTQMNNITTSPLFSISTTTKILPSSQPSMKTTTFPKTSFSSSKMVMSSSTQSTTEPPRPSPTPKTTTKFTTSKSMAISNITKSSSAITNVPTATQKHSLTAAQVTSKSSLTMLPTTQVTHFKDNSTSASMVSTGNQNSINFTKTYTASTSKAENSRPSNKVNNETARTRIETAKSDQSRQPTVTSSSMNSQTKAIIIGISVSLVCLSIGLIILIVALRRRKRQKSMFIYQNDFHPSQHPEDSSSDTVGIVNRIHGADVMSGTGKSNENIFNGNQGNNSQNPAAVGKKSRSFRTGSSSRIGMDCFSPSSHDDSEMLVYSWDEANQ